MCEFNDQAIAALQEIGWGAKQPLVGKYPAWHLVTETPAFKFDVLVRIFPVSKRLVVLRARSSYDPDFAAYLFSRASEDELGHCQPKIISILPSFSFQVRTYDGIGIAPPSVAKCFSSQSRFLESHSFWVFPVMNDDFRGDEDGDAFHFRLGKGGQIPIIDWNRDRNLGA